MTSSVHLHSLLMQTIISARSMLKLQWQKHEVVVILSNFEIRAFSSVLIIYLLMFWSLNYSHRSSQLLLGTVEVTHVMPFLRKHTIATWAHETLSATFPVSPVKRRYKGKLLELRSKIMKFVFCYHLLLAAAASHSLRCRNGKAHAMLAVAARNSIFGIR